MTNKTKKNIRKLAENIRRDRVFIFNNKVYLKSENLSLEMKIRSYLPQKIHCPRHYVKVFCNSNQNLFLRPYKFQ